MKKDKTAWQRPGGFLFVMAAEKMADAVKKFLESFP